MIQNTFLFLERVKRGLEENLWKQGINDWDSFINAEKIGGISKKRKIYYDRKILEARKALYSQDSSYFKKKEISQKYPSAYCPFRVWHNSQLGF